MDKIIGAYIEFSNKNNPIPKAGPTREAATNMRNDLPSNITRYPALSNVYQHTSRHHTVIYVYLRS